MRVVGIVLLVLCAELVFSQASNRTLIVKIKPEARDAETIRNVLRSNSATRPKPLVSEKSEYLDGVYLLRIKDGEDVEKIADELRKTGQILYVEQPNQESLLFTPNDPLAQPGAGQFHLSVTKAYEAWDISQGSSTSIIGISDTGIDLTHPDIKDNIYRNPNEIFNGLDDDGNGYVDDIRGYDFADDDSVAQIGSSYHGNMVAGVAAASTNNGIGIAGTAFKAKVSPLKMFTSTTTESFGAYETILYAANEGFDVINLSWGSVNTYSQAAQDIINYAVLEKDLIIVAAAGNTNELLDFYPASYDHVLSVGSTTADDVKAPLVTYSYNIDLMAPGVQILSTSKNSGYTAESGSSFAAPQVAGAATLVKTRYPTLNAEQIMEVLRVTTDDIYSLAGNSSFYGKLGSGRLNMYKSLTMDTLRSVRARELSLTNDFGEYAFYGDTLSLDFKLKNYLFPFSGGQVKFSTESPHVHFLTSGLTIGFTDSIQTLSLSEDLLTLNENTPADITIPIRLDFAHGKYRDFQYLLLKTSPDYLTVGNEATQLKLGGNGGLGIIPGKTDFGFKSGENQLVRNLGFMVGNSKSLLSDNILNNPTTKTIDGDFQTRKGIRYRHYDVVDNLATSTFDDTHSLRVYQSVFSDRDSVNENFIILKYEIVNTGSDTLKNLQAGMYADWSLINNTRNKGQFSSSGHFAYAFDSDSSQFAAIKLYGETNPVHQSVDLAAHNGNTVDLSTDLNDSIKYKLLSAHLFDNAGMTDIGNDIAQSISTSKFTLPPKNLKEFYFILAAAKSKADLDASIATADLLIDQIKVAPEVLESVASCSGASVIIDPSNGTSFAFYSDSEGKNLIAQNDTLFTGPLATDTSFYARSLDSDYQSPLKRIKIKMIQNVASFSSPVDTLYLDQPYTKLTIQDKSFRAIKWSWDFGNGSKSTVQNPSTYYSQAGTYTISLHVENSLGCEGDFSRQLVVAKRPTLPQIPDHLVCFGGAVKISDNQKKLRIYASAGDTKPITIDTAYTLTAVKTDKMLYVSHDSLGFESLKKEVKVTIDAVDAEVSYTQDVTQASSVIKLFSKNQYPQITWTIDGIPMTGDTLLLTVEKTSYVVDLNVTNANGCQDSTQTTLTFSKSAKPAVGNLTACINTDFILKPSGGNLFGFYQDLALTQLIAKANQITLPSITEETTIYIVGLDQTLPSDPVTAMISVDDFYDSIIASPETLYLSEGKTATFKGLNPASVSRTWFLNNKSVAIADSLRLFFTEPGSHSIVLNSSNARGCSSADTLAFEVGTERPLTIGRPLLSAIYPNPVDKVVNLHLLGTASVEIRDISGRKILDAGEIEGVLKISVEGLPAGIYLIHIRADDAHELQRIIVR